MIKYTKSRRAVARHVYRPLFLRAATSGGSGAGGLFDAAGISRRCGGSRGEKGPDGGGVANGAGKSAARGGCRVARVALEIY